MVSSRLRRSLLLRSFLIQGSWNYRTVLGSGLAWALLPVHRSATSRDVRADRRARAALPFNAHPYMSALALGALARAEEEEAETERILRFRDALRSPLGSLGDVLVWAALRPACLLGAILAVLLGTHPLVAVAGFLLLYNAVHVALRVWGVRAGLALGFGVGEAIRRAEIPVWAERIAGVGVLLLGLICGLLAGHAATLPLGGLPWLAGGGVLFLVGYLGGDSLRRWGPAMLLALFLLGAVLAPPWLGSTGH